MNTRFVVALLVYALALSLVTHFEPALPQMFGAAIFELQSRARLLSVATALLSWAAWALVRFVPLGVLLVLTLRDHESFRERWKRVVAPVSVAVIVLPLLVVTARDGGAPNPLALTLGWLGAGLGAWLALTFRRGPRARRWLVPKLAGALVLLGCGIALLGLLAVEGAPRVAERPDIGSDGRRALVGLFRGADPRKFIGGEQRTLTIPAPQLDQLVAWGARVAVRGRTQLQLQQGGAALQLSVPVPGSARWLNIEASSGVRAGEGELVLESPRLTIGRVWVPSWVLSLGARSVVARLKAHEDSRQVLVAIKALALSPEVASLRYGKVDVPAGLAARLMWGAEQRDDMHAAVQAHIDELLRVLPTVPAGDARFASAMQSAFTLAQARSVNGSAVNENRAALLALGVVLGHRKLVRVLGDQLPEEQAIAIDRVREGTTLRSRNDWTRHFTVSAALTVVSSVAPSDAAGLLKEELDADGGSGFSFADLLADRSGTELAQVATRDESSARRTQERVVRGFQVDDFFASADGLPEGIADAEFQSRYGGVGGPLFRTLSADIERRVAASAAYRD